MQRAYNVALITVFLTSHGILKMRVPDYDYDFCIKIIPAKVCKVHPVLRPEVVVANYI